MSLNSCATRKYARMSALETRSFVREEAPLLGATSAFALFAELLTAPVFDVIFLFRLRRICDAILAQSLNVISFMAMLGVTIPTHSSLIFFVFELEPNATQPVQNSTIFG